MNIEFVINFAYIVSAWLFIAGLKMLGHPESARKGNLYSSIGMLLAVVITLLSREVVEFQWIVLGIFIGSLIGTLMARLVAMTQMPEMVAAFNGFGGIASLLVGWGVFHSIPDSTAFSLATIVLSVLIGGVTFTGSIVAWGKLSEILPGRPILFPGQKIINALLMAAIIIAGVLFVIDVELRQELIIAIILASLILGIITVIPIGGADMPVIISLLNSYSGLAACAAGFAIQNNILIVSGALVGGQWYHSDQYNV